MNELKVFENCEFGSIRMIEESGKVLFCGTDVAKALGYDQPHKAIDRHCRYGMKRTVPHPQSPNKQMEMIFIPEGDLYRLITHSKLPSAERFEQWVFDEVLPTIRKHGAYITKEKLWEIATSPEAMHKLTGDLLAERELNRQLTEENRLLSGKARYYDYFIAADACTNLRETAKELAVSERKLARFLVDAELAYRAPGGHLLPYSKTSNEGLFVVRDYISRNGHRGSYMLISPKGKLLLHSLRDVITAQT
ncbi:MAG: phage antirepressor KilAC domain-containing protein [Oscillospiraceae bacterium]|nr:phage antirepressor KilAC domain-containing protein [Oscillospiraceae bacterium]